MATVKVGPKYQVVIPAEVRALIGIHPGDEVVVEEVEGVVVILPKPSSYADWAMGLGREAWGDVDAETYVEAERDSWR